MKHTHELCTEEHDADYVEDHWMQPHCRGCGESMRYSVVKLEGRREGWQVFDAVTQATVVGTRSTTRREAYEALEEITR